MTTQPVTVIVLATTEQIELANYILKQAILALSDNHQARYAYGITVNNLHQIEEFRQALITKYLQQTSQTQTPEYKKVV